jgi:hypothetical protein
MRDEAERTRLMIKALIAIVVVLGLIVIYLLVAQPAYNNALNQAGYSGFGQGINYTINSILSSIQTKGYVQIPLGNNRTLILVPYVPSNATAQAASSGNKTA